MKKRVSAADNGSVPAYMSFQDYAIHVGVGRATARKIATEAGAIRRIGRRALINVEEADNFIESKKDA